jgi:ABC-type multidrug transport system ATPase subunit
MISINSLSRCINKKIILNSVNLCIETGQIHALLGHNGAGKTTIIKTILGLIKPTSGSVFVDGNDT